MSLQNKTFDELITFTRATGGGRFNASGQYEWLPANKPRIDYDPVTKECRGILIEEQRTNLFTYSEDFSNTVWSKSQGTAVAEGIAAWSGRPQYRLTATEAGAFAGRLTRAVGVSSASYSCGFFIKRGTTNWACITVEMTAVGEGRRVWFDLVDGVVGGNATAGSASHLWTWRAGIQKVSESEFFCWVSVDVTESGSLSSVIIAPDSNLSSTVSVGNSIFISGAQLEQGAFPTSYIPTTTAQVTRAADLCSVNDLSPWYRADEGTLMADYRVPTGRGKESYIAAFDRGTTFGPRIQLSHTPNDKTALSVVDDAGSPVVPSLISGSGYGLSAAAYKNNDFAISVNSSTAAVDTSGAVPTGIVRLAIGRLPGAAPLNGHIRRIRYIPRRISNAELQSLTAI